MSAVVLALNSRFSCVSITPFGAGRTGRIDENGHLILRAVLDGLR